MARGRACRCYKKLRSDKGSNMSTQSGFFTAPELCPKCIGSLLATCREFTDAYPAITRWRTTRENSNCSHVNTHKHDVLRTRAVIHALSAQVLSSPVRIAERGTWPRQCGSVFASRQRQPLFARIKSYRHKNEAHNS